MDIADKVKGLNIQIPYYCFLNKSREGEGFKKRIIAFIPHISGYFLYILDKEDITVEMNRDCLIS